MKHLHATIQNIRKAIKYVSHLPKNLLLHLFFYQRIIKKTVTKITQISNTTTKPIIVHITLSNYLGNLSHRCHHMLRELAEAGYIVLWPEQNITRTIRLDNNFYIFPRKALNKIILLNRPTVLNIWTIGYPFNELKNLYQTIPDLTPILLEHVDDFDICTSKNEKKLAIQMTEHLMQRSNTLVLATADKLYQEMIKFGVAQKNLVLSKNAVRLCDFEHIPSQTPKIIQKILDRGKPIIGYYGTLAKGWFDFGLCQSLIEQNSHFEFIFIGNKWDNTANFLEDYSNYTYIPPLPYAELPRYAGHFDVAILPFLINEITVGTSPVKIFEYMAMGLPIVTTPLPECKLYQSCFIAENNCKDFSNALEQALKNKKDKTYREILRKEASENTWEVRAKEVLHWLEGREGNQSFNNSR